MEEVSITMGENFEVRGQQLPKSSALSRPAESYINVSYLHELSGGDIPFIKEIFETFLSDAPNVLRTAQTSLKNGDYRLLKITVHKLKSSVQILGNDQLAAQIQIIENLATDSTQYSLIPELLIKMNHEVNNMMEVAAAEVRRL